MLQNIAVLSSDYPLSEEDLVVLIICAIGLIKDKVTSIRVCAGNMTCKVTSEGEHRTIGYFSGQLFSAEVEKSGWEDIGEVTFLLKLNPNFVETIMMQYSARVGQA